MWENLKTCNNYTSSNNSGIASVFSTFYLFIYSSPAHLFNAQYLWSNYVLALF